MRLVLVGPPGSGKGTQAKLIAEHFGIPAISTGDIFRRNVAGETDLGVQAKKFMDSGDYVPDSLTNAMVRERLAEADCEPGFLLDGYPRTIDQVDALDGMLSEQGRRLDAVVELVAPADEVVPRLLLRAETEGRADDTEDVVRRRLEVYAEQTEPLIDVYRKQGILLDVDGLGEIPEVADRIRAALEGVSR
ncbi:MAG: adenylate kinase [Candidatus Nanopelagicales bacterium]